eukprot:scaffold5.g994.t1
MEGSTPGSMPRGSPPASAPLLGGPPVKPKGGRLAAYFRLLRQLVPAAAVLLLVLFLFSSSTLYRRHRLLRDMLDAAAYAPADHVDFRGGGGDAAAAGEGGAARSAAAARARPADACADALELPRVALLFLVKGPMRHEELWRRWFAYAADLVPTPFVQQRLCGTTATRQQQAAFVRALESCGGAAPPGAQHAAGVPAASEQGRGQAQRNEQQRGGQPGQASQQQGQQQAASWGAQGDDAFELQPQQAAQAGLTGAQAAKAAQAAAAASAAQQAASQAAAKAAAKQQQQQQQTPGAGAQQAWPRGAAVAKAAAGVTFTPSAEAAQAAAAHASAAAAARSSSRVQPTAEGRPRRLLRWPHDPAAEAAVKQASTPAGDAAQILQRQHLFDVYVHPHPDYAGFPAGSLFAGRELPIAQRVKTGWGEHTLVDAARTLLAAAAANPHAQKFMLLSESDVPLYSPHMVYSQLMSEERSRINACNTTEGWGTDDWYRWVDRMERPFLKKWHWRKSWQWFGLNRDHVELVLADRAVDGVFRAHCRESWEDKEAHSWWRGDYTKSEHRVCYSDEHYLPTLLAVHGRDAETDCQGHWMDIDWSRVESTSPHPWEYVAAEIDEHLFQRRRHSERGSCSGAQEALATARRGFLPAAELRRHVAAGAAPAAAAKEVCAASGAAPRYAPLGVDCPLVARKFKDSTILSDGTCGGSAAAIARYRAWLAAAPPLVLLSGLLLLPALFSSVVVWLVRPQMAFGVGGEDSFD